MELIKGFVGWKELFIEVIGTFKSYNYYNNYMETTTIALRKDVREKIVEFGNKGETYPDIILRLIESAKQRQLQDLLMSEENTSTIDEALFRAKKRWQK